MRGMHLRAGAGEAKLVRCSYGEVFDVVVDLRADSPTYRNVEYFDLSGDTQVTVYVPAGCAHGFQALTGSGRRLVPDRPGARPEPRTCRSPSTTRSWPSTWPLPVSLMSGPGQGGADPRRGHRGG